MQRQKWTEGKNNGSIYQFKLGDCHVVSHWEDRNMITTILLFELAVASHQRMTVKNVGHRGETHRCLYLVISLGSPDTGRKKREAKWLAGTPKRKWGLLPVSGNR